MKVLLLALLAASLSACTATRPLSGRIALGRVVRTSNQLEVAARLTNTSNGTVWFVGPLGMPGSSIRHYDLSTRANERSAWSDYPSNQSGLLMDVESLKAGESSSFTVLVPVGERGRQLQISVPIRAGPAIYGSAVDTLIVKSAPTFIP